MKLSKKKAFVLKSAALVLLLSVCAGSAAAQNVRNVPAALEHERAAGPVVYMTAEISPASLQRVYEALGRKAAASTPDGKVAVKISTGEPGGKNFLQPALIGKFIRDLNGTIVECNTAYGGRRASTALHKQVLADHGFTAVAPCDILDEDGSTSIPVTGGIRIKEAFVGSHFDRYDFYVILSHFKGHAMGGFGGAIKNIAIGMQSSMGKAWVHSGGKSKTNPWGGKQDEFLEAMAEATKGFADYQGERILYINVMNRLSVDCDCDANPAEPDMHDIGILASLDPVALDQACVDFVYAAADGGSLRQRIESRNGIHTLEHAAAVGLGSRTYRLVRLE